MSRDPQDSIPQLPKVVAPLPRPAGDELGLILQVSSFDVPGGFHFEPELAPWERRDKLKREDNHDSVKLELETVRENIKVLDSIGSIRPLVEAYFQGVSEAPRPARTRSAESRTTPDRRIDSRRRHQRGRRPSAGYLDP